MEALVMTCSTGGGHYSAALGVYEALKSRGHLATILDPYTLVSNRRSNQVGNAYIKLVQKTPKLFGVAYQLGNLYQKLPITSPVYWLNTLMINKMNEYLSNHHYDVIICTHLFPIEILTAMKKRGYKLPLFIMVATDYTNIPFNKETKPDYLIIASNQIIDEYLKAGIPQEILVPIGIPVKKAFYQPITRIEARLTLGLDLKKQYLLLSGGSIGAGNIKKSINVLLPFLKNNPFTHLIILTGNNESLYNALISKYSNNHQMTILKKTNKMAYYLKACDIFLTKPGGLSSSEAATVHIPMIHITPIPGCETMNAKFFSERGMSIWVKNLDKELIPAISKVLDYQIRKAMIQSQKDNINQQASLDLCRFIEEHIN